MLPSSPDESHASIEALGRTAFLGRAIREGDGAAFEELFHRVMPALYAWIEVRVRRGARFVDAQDLVQEVWLRAYSGLASYDPSRSFRAWILGIAKNVLLQAHERRPSTPLGDESVSDSVTSVSMRFAKSESLERFLDFVAQLDPDDRALLLYCGIEEYTCAEAAERLGIGTEAATKRWQALRARIRSNGALASLASGILD